MFSTIVEVTNKFTKDSKLKRVKKEKKKIHYFYLLI